MERTWLRLYQHLGGDPTAALTLRVRADIRRRDDNSEILIAACQLAAVAIFAVLYAGSPKGFTAEVPFEPVPWALGIYATFLAVKLVLGLARKLPAAMVAASVLVDMAVLLVTIWSFHVQYGQSPDFSLKVPTLLYVFILIAIRVLRFEASYVVLAGATAGLGWAALVGAAFYLHPDPSPRTHSFIEYVRGAKILVGAEVDKLLSIAMVTAVLAIAQMRARRTLIRSIAESTAAAELARFFAPEVARQIASADRPIEAGQGELREAAILNLDLRGFTPLARTLSPSAAIQMLAEYQARLVPIIHRHGGSVDKFLGDGIMATFGAAVPSPSYAADALRAVGELALHVDAWNADRRAAGQPAANVGMAVATGPIIFGAVGDATRLEYTVIGDAVNLAAKLEKQTKAEGVRALTTAEALAIARAQGYESSAALEVRRGASVGGVPEPVDLVVLTPAG